MSNENQIIEDVEIEDIVNQELEADETEVVSEEIEVAEESQPLSDTVLNVLLGEAKKNEAEHESDKDEDSDVEEEEEDEIEEGKHEKEEDAHGDEKEEDAHDDDKKEEEDELDEGDAPTASDNAKATDDSVKKIGDLDKAPLPEVTTKAGYLAAAFSKLKEMKKSQLVSAYKAVNMTEGEHEEDMEIPKTKAEIINAMYGQLKNMKKDDIVASYKNIMASHCESVKEDIDAFADDLAVLAEEDANLTDDFKSKAILFEGAVANRVTEIKEALEAQYTEDLQEEVTYIRESLVSKIDDYLSYVVESWIEENQEFVDNKLRTEITEDFMKALQNVFTEHYIEVPESKIDLVDELSDEVNSVQESLDVANAQNKELSEKVEKLERASILAEASTDLSTVDSEKLISLTEEVAFENAEGFAEKVATIKDTYFNGSETETETEEELSEAVNSENVETIVEGEGEVKLPSDMARYVKTLSRFKD